jgi:hypothetical protein
LKSNDRANRLKAAFLGNWGAWVRAGFPRTTKAFEKNLAMRPVAPEWRGLAQPICAATRAA